MSDDTKDDITFDDMARIRGILATGLAPNEEVALYFKKMFRAIAARDARIAEQAKQIEVLNILHDGAQRNCDDHCITIAAKDKRIAELEALYEKRLEELDVFNKQIAEMTGERNLLQDQLKFREQVIEAQRAEIERMDREVASLLPYCKRD